MADYYTKYAAEIDNLTDDEIKCLEVRLKDFEDARADDDDFDQDVDDLGQMELSDRAIGFCGEESGDPRLRCGKCGGAGVESAKQGKGRS